MHIFISADMEGISGVVDCDQVTPGHAEYTRFRDIMTEEVNAAIDGALQAGATAITVTDGHDAGRNLLIEKLHAPARLITGSPTPLSMVQGVESAFAAFFIGYHAKAGTINAILDHTWSSIVRRVEINRQEIGEIGLNAAVCGSFNVPVALVSGDHAATDEARALIGSLETVAVKHAVGRIAAECLPIEETRRAIQEAATRALAHCPAPFVFKPPIHLTVELTRSDQADRALRVPGTRRLNGTSVAWTGMDMPTAYNAFRAIVALDGA